MPNEQGHDNVVRDLGGKKGHTMLTGNDFDQIRAVVTLYLDGMFWGEPEKLRQAFHPKATATGHYQGSYWNNPRDEFIVDWMAEETLAPGTPYSAGLTFVDVTGDMAMAKVTGRYLGDDYTDFLTLIKDSGQWQITHKAWFAHPTAE